MNTTHRKRILCHVCNGEGVKDYTEQRGPMILGEVETCRNCKGTGREYKVITIEVHYEPFKPIKHV